MNRLPQAASWHDWVRWSLLSIIGGLLLGLALDLVTYYPGMAFLALSFVLYVAVFLWRPPPVPRKSRREE